jgi:hypothetical protein
MPYTHIQQLRKARAKNKGANRKMAVSLRAIAEWLDKKGPEEFSASESKQLQTLAKMITLRLGANEITKSISVEVAEIEKRKAGTSRPQPR